MVESHLRGSAVESLVASVDLPPEEESDAGWDTTVVMDVYYDTCIDGASGRPRLFTLPPKLAADRQFWLLSGLYYAQEDAKRALARMRIESRVEGKIVKIRAAGPVLQRAFSREE